MNYLRRFKTEYKIFAIVFIIQIIGIFSRSIPVITDELNPLALIFKATGDDWSSYLTADGYYYKYGQLLIHLPALLLIRNPVWFFRSILIVNSFLVSFISICAYTILNKYLKCSDSFKSSGIAFLTGIMPTITLNSKLAWGEPILIALSWINLLMLLRCISKERRKLSAHRCSIILALFQSYAYMVHNRGIVIVLASVCCVFFARFILKNRNIKIITYFLTILVVLYADSQISVLIRNSLYLEEGKLIGGGIEFINVNLLMRMFSRKGIQTIFQEIMGWMFACAASTFGLMVFGLMASARILLGIKRKQEYSNPEILIAMFAVLCFLGTLVLGGTFFFDSMYVAGQEISKRGEKLVYVRYLDAANMMLSFLGLYYLLADVKHNSKKFLYYSIAGFIVLQGFYVSVISERINHTVIWSNCIMLIGYFCKMNQSIRSGMYSQVGFLAGGIGIFGLFAIGIYCLVIYFRNKIRMVMGICTIVFLIGYLWNSYNILYRMDHYLYDLVYCYADIFREVESQENMKNIYLEDEIVRVGFQYVYHDYYIITDRDSSGKEKENMFILAKSDFANQVGEDSALYEMVSEKRNAEISLYIKGHELNDYIQKLGYKTEEVTVRKYV